MADLEADLTLNVRQFVAEAKKAGLSLEDIVSGFDDVADESSRTERDVVSDLKRISRQAKDTGDDLDRDVGGGFRDLKDEARQSGAEAAQSFTGEWDDVGDFIQETVAQGLSGFGPIGAVAGIALAAGLGALLTETQRVAKESEDRVRGMYEDMIKSGQNFASQKFIESGVGTIIGDPAKLAEAQRIVDNTGATIQTVLRAMAGEQSSINAVIDEANAKRDIELGKLRATADGSAANANAQDAVNLKIDDAISKLTGVTTETQKAVEQAAIYRSTVDTANDSLDTQKQKVKDVEEQARRLAQSPYTLKFDADASEIERKIGLLQGRKVTLNVEGQITRIGNQVW